METQQKSPMQTRKLKILYWVMFRLMDIESIMWAIADAVIFPIALLRRVVAKIINNRL